MKHKLESRLQGETSVTSDIQMAPPYGRKWKRTEKALDESERGGWKAGLKLNIQKTKIVASIPITLMQIEGEKWKQWQILFSWAPKSLRVVTAAMKLKDAGVLVLPPSDAYVRSFLYLLYTLIKLYYTKALSD